MAAFSKKKNLCCVATFSLSNISPPKEGDLNIWGWCLYFAGSWGWTDVVSSVLLGGMSLVSSLSIYLHHIKHALTSSQISWIKIRNGVGTWAFAFALFLPCGLPSLPCNFPAQNRKLNIRGLESFAHALWHVCPPHICPLPLAGRHNSHPTYSPRELINK